MRQKSARSSCRRFPPFIRNRSRLATSWMTRSHGSLISGISISLRIAAGLKRGNWVLRSGFDDGSHGSKRARKAPVRSVGMNEIALVLGLLELTGDQDRGAFGIDLDGVRERRGFAHAENLL